MNEGHCAPARVRLYGVSPESARADQDPFLIGLRARALYPPPGMIMITIRPVVGLWRVLRGQGGETVGFPWPMHLPPPGCNTPCMTWPPGP
jgi:hypothetical protein